MQCGGKENYGRATTSIRSWILLANFLHYMRNVRLRLLYRDT